MPKVLLEAMSCGLPVIGSKIDGTKEVIVHGENGLLCDTGSNSIREAIVTVMNDTELRDKLGANARKTIMENYSLELILDKELILLQGLI
jgi:glycosyltransferase involved in cell wall biosynthesis